VVYITKLTPKQQRFVDEYLIDLNGTQAAIRAGYSPKSAGSTASQCLANPEIRAAVDTAIAKRSRRTGIHADRVLRELAKIGFVNATDVIDDDGSVRATATSDDTASIKSVKVKTVPKENGDIVEREVRLNDKLRALELIGRHLGLFNDKLAVTNMPPPTIVDDLE